jgi:hypothetical protein
VDAGLIEERDVDEHNPDSLTPGVRLREVIESDLPIFFEQQHDPQANQMAAFPARDREAFMVHSDTQLERVRQSIYLKWRPAGWMIFPGSTFMDRGFKEDHDITGACLRYSTW